LDKDRFSTLQNCSETAPIFFSLLFFSSVKLPTMFFTAVFLGFFAALVVADDANPCTSFSINESSVNTFQYYRFYDFRNLVSGDTVVIQNNTLPFRSQLRTANIANSSWTEDWNIQDKLKEPAEYNDLTWSYTPHNVAIGTYYIFKA
jgi:hypothetical protein